MKVELQINNSISVRANYVGWAPSPCRIRVTNPVGALTHSSIVCTLGAYRPRAAARSCSARARRARSRVR